MDTADTEYLLHVIDGKIEAVYDSLTRLHHKLDRLDRTIAVDKMDQIIGLVTTTQEDIATMAGTQQDLDRAIEDVANGLNRLEVDLTNKNDQTTQVDLTPEIETLRGIAQGLTSLDTTVTTPNPGAGGTTAPPVTEPPTPQPTTPPTDQPPVQQTTPNQPPETGSSGTTTTTDASGSPVETPVNPAPIEASPGPKDPTDTSQTGIADESPANPGEVSPPAVGV